MPLTGRPSRSLRRMSVEEMSIRAAFMNATCAPRARHSDAASRAFASSSPGRMHTRKPHSVITVSMLRQVGSSSSVSAPMR